MSDLEKLILDIVQDNFPIQERPYLALSKILNEHFLQNVVANISEKVAFETVENLRKNGIIRRIGGVYDSKKLGLVSRLCACHIDCNYINNFAEVVNNIDAITHNYIRDNFYNVWFTIIAESEQSIFYIVDKLTKKCNLQNVHILPAQKMFKINTVMKHSKNVDKIKSQKICDNAAFLPQILTQNDKNRIRIVSGDLPHTLTPFAKWNVNLNEILSDLQSKKMRRFGAILRHQKAGFKFNAMVCFDTNSIDNCPNVEYAGKILAQKSYVTHCYERPIFENFSYNLYAMFHAESAIEIKNFIQEAARELNCKNYVVLNSVAELKKTSYKYFADTTQM